MARPQVGTAPSRTRDLAEYGTGPGGGGGSSINSMLVVQNLKAATQLDISNAPNNQALSAGVVLTFKMHMPVSSSVSFVQWMGWTGGSGMGGFYTALYGADGNLLAGSGSTDQQGTIIGAPFKTTFPTTTVPAGMFYLAVRAPASSNAPSMRTLPETNTGRLNAGMTDGVASATAPRIGIVSAAWSGTTPPASLGSITSDFRAYSLGVG